VVSGVHCADAPNDTPAKRAKASNVFFIFCYVFFD
jgi:hypothetical protein